MIALSIAALLACATEPSASNGLFGDRPRSTEDDDERADAGGEGDARDDATAEGLDATDDGAADF